MNASEVLARYIRDDLPEFDGIPLTDVNQPGWTGSRPLHVACCRCSVEEVTALLLGGADINARGELGNSPLHEAVGQNCLNVVEVLLANGANPTEINEFGQSPIDLARMMNRTEILMLLETEQ